MIVTIKESFSAPQPIFERARPCLVRTLKYSPPSIFVISLISKKKNHFHVFYNVSWFCFTTNIMRRFVIESSTMCRVSNHRSDMAFKWVKNTDWTMMCGNNNNKINNTSVGTVKSVYWVWKYTKRNSFLPLGFTSHDSCVGCGSIIP